MITGEIKNRIDSIWDSFWTGGITNSITILEQMTYLFFMKMLDDSQSAKEANANIMGVPLKDPVFKAGKWKNPDTERDVPYESLRWHVFKNKDAETMFITVSRDVFTFIKTLNDGKESAYSRFMESSTFLIPNARTLSKIVDGVDGLDMNNRDTMGDVYEYILGKMAASGTNGQFRTPRFIVEAAKFVQEHNKKALLKKENLEHYRNKMFHGFDTDQTMLRIGAMNLMLHGADNPDIAYRDSLSTDNTDENEYSLCLANPPFAGSLDYEAVNKTVLAITKTKKTELLFLALFVRMLQVGGRCASIVPDGVLFGNSTGHKSIRKELIEHQRLQAVISMPSGVFQPYSGVSTAILVFTKTNAGGTDKVWFYDMKADGYTLDQKRTECKENDIPDIVARWKNLAAEENRTRKDQSFFVPVDEIIANDYDLSINKYKEVEKVKVEYENPKTVFKRIAKLQDEINAAMEEFKEKYL